MSHHLGQSTPSPDEQRWRLLEQETSNSHCSRPDEPGTAVAEEGGPVIRAGADAAALTVTAPTPEAEGHSRTHSPDAGTVMPAKPATTPREADPAMLKKDLAKSRTAGGKAATARLTKRGDTGADDPETTGALGDSHSLHNLLLLTPGSLSSLH